RRLAQSAPSDWHSLPGAPASSGDKVRMKRTTIVRGVRVGALALVGLLGAGSAWAATEAVELEEESSLDDDCEPEEEADDFEPDEDAPENAAPPRIDEAAGSPFEKAGETYYFVGARYRALVVPQFMI